MSAEPRVEGEVEPRFAQLVEVGPDGIRIDGTSFPWLVDADITVEPANRHSPAVVCLRLYAERVETDTGHRTA